jgi:flavin reductase (DIM6/NTAB) family NADH-FMN oxidoreductase RutF
LGSQQEFRRCLGCFGTGVTVVAFDAEEGPRGITVNSFTSVSLEPPLVLVSISKRARSHHFLAGRPFSVNVLGLHQEPLARQFAGEPQEGLRILWERGSVAPFLQRSLAVFQCLPWAQYDGGDHTLFLGKVVHFSCAPGDALGFFRGRFLRISESAPALSPRIYDPFEMPYDSP